MPDFVNYSQILTDMRNAVETANLGFKRVFKNADDGELTFDNMPLCDLRLRRAVNEPLAGRQNYVTVTIEAGIAAYNMTSRDKCATIRDNLTNALQRFFMDNPRFSGMADSTLIGTVEFEIGETKDQGEFVAAAVASFNVLLYAG